jgi:hypothetical protein
MCYCFRWLIAVVVVDFLKKSIDDKQYKEIYLKKEKHFGPHPACNG